MRRGTPNGASPAAQLAVAELRSRTRPLSLAGERVLPLHPDLAALVPGGGLRRGSVVGCDGTMAQSVAMALSAAASNAGAWVAVVGVRGFGLAAAAEWGVALERVVGVGILGSAGVAGDKGAPPSAVSPQVLAAAVDGFDIVISTGAGIRGADANRLAARITQRGAVLLLVGQHGAFAADMVCSAHRPQWRGIGAGDGRLIGRRVEFEVSGRRIDRARRASLWFPSAGGGVAACDEGVTTRPAPLSVTRAG